MQTITENLITPVGGVYDAIVVGAGPAGCGAAIGAARSGAKTLLIEQNNCLGGAWTTGFMNPLFDHRNKKGFITELIADLKSAGQWGGFWNISFNYEYMKRLLDVKMKEAGVDVRCSTVFSRPICEGKTVKGVIVENRDGRTAYLGKVTFDCTGDGNVAAAAGCDFDIGVDGDYTQCQGMTLMFLVGNIPEEYPEGTFLGEILDECYAKAGLTAPFHMPFLIAVPGARFGVVQFTHMYDRNPLSQREVDEATAEGRRQMIEAYELLKKYRPEFANLDLIASAGVLGIRESRRIIGEYTLTAEDLIEGRHFDDAVCDVETCMDIHPKGNHAQDCRQVQPYQVPFRCLLPKGYSGLVVAGRCISGTHEAMASYRVTGNCVEMGEMAARRIFGNAN